MLKLGDPAFPGPLRRLPESERPTRLWVRGEIPPLPGVSIVGTRSPDAHGQILARRLARECAAAGITVISGGADGIDRAAHEGCLEGGGRTVVVQAGGLNHCHPASFTRLFDKIVTAGGCLISEHHPSVKPMPYLFLRRNRIIAALGGCTVIVQARRRSGALSTASWANNCGSELFAVAGSPLNPLYEGTNWLVRSGRARIVTTVPHFVKEATSLAAVTPSDTRSKGVRQTSRAGGPAPPAHGEDPIEDRILTLVAGEPLTLDEIAQLCGVTVEVAARALVALELKGLILMTDAGQYVNSHAK